MDNASYSDAASIIRDFCRGGRAWGEGEGEGEGEEKERHTRPTYRSEGGATLSAVHALCKLPSVAVEQRRKYSLSNFRRSYEQLGLGGQGPAGEACQAGRHQINTRK